MNTLAKQLLSAAKKRHNIFAGVTYRFLEHAKCLVKRIYGTQPREEDRYTWLARSKKAILGLNIVRTVHVSVLDVWEKAAIHLQHAHANQTVGSQLHRSTAKLFKMRAALIRRARPTMAVRKQKSYLYKAAATQSCAQDGGNFQLQKLATSYSRRLHGATIQKQRDNERMAMFTIPYAQAYQVYRNQQLGDKHGPADLLSVRHVWLLLRYIGEHQFWVPWQHVVSASGLGTDYFYWLLFRAVRLRRLQIRSRVIDAVEGSLRINMLPIPQEIYVIAPRRTAKRHFAVLCQN